MPGRTLPTRILLDQNTPLGLRRALPGYEVIPARGMGWATIENGELIRAAEKAGFAILITCDRNIRYQQNLTGRKLAFVVLGSNIWPVVRDHGAAIAAKVDAATPGSYEFIEMPLPPKQER